MERPISEIAFTATVKSAQEKRGSRASYANMEQRGDPGPWHDVVTPDLAEFIGEQDSLYLGTASADGQPYVQYRGGPKGFLKVLDEHTLALAARGRSTFSELRWYPPMEAAKGSMSWVFRAKQPESVRTGP